MQRIIQNGIFTVLLVLASVALWAQETEKPAQTPENAPGGAETAKTGAKETESAARQKTAPKPTAPVIGFHEDALFVSIFGGKALAPNGSFIRHEKYYDSWVRTAIVQGTFGEKSVLQPGLPFIADYLPGDTYQFDLEYGLFEHLGLGLSLFQYDVKVARQDVHTFPFDVRIYDPVPTRRRLFRGTTAAVMLSFHPLSRKEIDPYLTARAGGASFTGEAHQFGFHDNLRFTNEIKNGTSMMVGAGLGVNLFWNDLVGLKMEASFNRQFLRSALFSTRTLNTYHGEIGVIFNYRSLAKAL